MPTPPPPRSGAGKACPYSPPERPCALASPPSKQADTFTVLQAKNTQLDQLRSRRVVLFTKLHAQLVALYNSLETPAPQRKPFARDKYFDGDNIGQPLLKAYEDEIQQCITQKRSSCPRVFTWQGRELGGVECQNGIRGIQRVGGFL